ncbi:hypothetical protein Bbelb_409970 [Branchiostoma belcheri]|nr:hypothetical protein Bbelb_409970 [Branchiostoma belcheri]
MASAMYADENNMAQATTLTKHDVALAITQRWRGTRDAANLQQTGVEMQATPAVTTDPTSSPILQYRTNLKPCAGTREWVGNCGSRLTWPEREEIIDEPAGGSAVTPVKAGPDPGNLLCFPFVHGWMTFSSAFLPATAAENGSAP